jgi:membrane-associated phospholipid phosphatase
LTFAAGGTRPGGIARAGLISGNIALHTICHDIVNAWNAKRPSSDFHDFSTSIDQWIPYVPWTWVVYYFGDLYILFWGSYVVWKMPHRDFTRTILVYSVMIIAGALMHFALPGRSPWPENGSWVQHWFHERITFDPYVCLPSMHVALTVLPTCMTFDLFSARPVRIVTTILAVLITVSTLTLKEHYALDALAGILLGLICYAFWRMPRRRTHDVIPTGLSHDDRQTQPL